MCQHRLQISCSSSRGRTDQDRQTWSLLLLLPLDISGALLLPLLTIPSLLIIATENFTEVGSMILFLSFDYLFLVQSLTVCVLSMRCVVFCRVLCIPS